MSHTHGPAAALREYVQTAVLEARQSNRLKRTEIWLLPIQACDEFGNELQSGGDAFAASIQGLGADAVKITDRGDGTHAARFTVPCEGTYALSVTGADGRHVRGSPATLTVFRCEA